MGRSRRRRPVTGRTTPCDTEETATTWPGCSAPKRPAANARCVTTRRPSTPCGPVRAATDTRRPAERLVPHPARGRRLAEPPTTNRPDCRCAHAERRRTRPARQSAGNDHREDVETPAAGCDRHAPAPTSSTARATCRPSLPKLLDTPNPAIRPRTAAARLRCPSSATPARPHPLIRYNRPDNRGGTEPTGAFPRSTTSSITRAPYKPVMPRHAPTAARTTPSDLLDGLNDRQLEAVAAPDGALLVIAGPGSGKTRVICTRVAHLVRARGVDPRSIAAPDLHLQGGQRDERTRPRPARSL